jgi:hypothetical protein
MKKIYLTLIAIFLIFQFSNAQWTTSGTNIYNSNTGGVGIGTTTPSGPLDVAGSWGAFSSTAHVTSQFVQDHTNNRGIYLGYDGSGQIGIIAGNSISAPSNIAFWNNNGTAWFEAMRLTSTGNLGIGVINPLARLHVVGTTLLNGNNANIDPNITGMSLSYLANSSQMMIGWNRTSGSGEADFIANQGAGGPGGFAFYNHDNSNNENMLMWIQGTSGNVLIGEKTQVNAAYKLDVNGAGRFTSVVVNTTGADFVFEPTYHLFPLADLKKYLDQNHHLPEIPSAKEMQANGLNVGDNQIKLLQKVEELTLYLIEKDKKEQEQEAINKKLQAQIDLLMKKMAELSASKN